LEEKILGRRKFLEEENSWTKKILGGRKLFVTPTQISIHQHQSISGAITQAG
jgi:hypothetical protein